MAITEQDYEDWKSNPVTEWVLSAIKKAAYAQKDEWVSLSWDSGKCDLEQLNELRTRADAYMALVETSYERWAVINDI